ncbi:hypothetical protein GCM10017562_43970 [Streptomyces roseofulvus]|uniref:Uncharacterized protein n=2 Tax=Streptomyces TaxID=1883 RepID=A0ABU4KDW7_9ACTN|nr:hypothetical protein [Streptomyces roseolus]MDX2295985.1 hypothetical protein [Streptomyces roseolus]
MIRTRIALAAAVAALAVAAPVAQAADSAAGPAVARITAAGPLGEEPVVVTPDDMIWQ